MLARATGRLPYLTSVTLAAAALISTVGFFGTAFIVGFAQNGLPARTFFGALGICCWTASPFGGVLMLARHYAFRRSSSIVILMGTLVIVGWTMPLLFGIAAHPSDGQNGLSVAFLPLFQWMVVLVMRGLAAGS